MRAPVIVRVTAELRQLDGTSQTFELARGEVDSLTNITELTAALRALADEFDAGPDLAGYPA